MNESETKPKVRMARMASASDVERHKAFLSTTELGKLATPQPSATPRRDEPWKIYREWTGVPVRGRLNRLIAMFRGHGYKDEHFLPSFVMWDPKGNFVYSSPDPAHLTRWDVEDRYEHTEIAAGWGGGTHRAYWASNGEWVLCTGALHSGSRMGSSFVSSSHGEYCGAIENFSYRFGMGDPRDNTRSEFNPWRPFDKRFVNLPEYAASRFDLHGMEYGEKGYRLVVRETVQLSELETDDRDVISYIWHPSGRYLAFASKITNHNTSQSVMRIHLMEWDTAQIVLSTPPFITRSYADAGPWCCAWSPGGRWLALDHSAERIWDVHTGEVSALPAEAETSEWIRHMRAAEATSADGERELRRVGERYAVVATSGGFCFDTPARHAAWHPTDPLCFATVGGEGAEHTVRVWQLRPQA